jgi:hypothetical protein
MVIIISVSCQPDLAFSRIKLYIDVTNIHFFNFLEADWLICSLLVDKTRFFNKLHENFLLWTMSLVAVPVDASWMTATLLDMKRLRAILDLAKGLVPKSASSSGQFDIDESSGRATLCSDEETGKNLY